MGSEYLGINAYFGQIYLTTSATEDATPDEAVNPTEVYGTLGIKGPTGEVLMHFTSLLVRAEEFDGKASNAAYVTGWGYWIPTGTEQEIPCLVTAIFVQPTNGTPTVTMTITQFGVIPSVIILACTALPMTGTTGLTMDGTHPVLAPVEPDMPGQTLRPAPLKGEGKV